MGWQRPLRNLIRHQPRMKDRMNDHSRLVMAARSQPVPRPGYSVQRIATAMLLGLATLGWGSPALHAQDIIVPNEFAEVDGPSANTTPDGTVNGLRFMNIYDASQFAALTQPAFLTGYTLRPDQVAGPSGPRTIRAKIYASTTHRPLAEFSTQFDDNIGPDNTLVFDGTLVVSTENQPGPGNTREFDYAWPFTTPYLYDPTAGNLVVDVQILQSSGAATRIDGMDGSPVARQLSAPGSPTAATGQFFGAPVTRLSFAPALPITIRTSQVEVCWESVPDATYRVEWRSEVSPGDWSPVVECVRSTGSTTCVQDAVAPGEPRRFYRVVRVDCEPQ